MKKMKNHYTPELEGLAERILPATRTWLGGTSDWATGSNWSGNAIPTQNDDVVLAGTTNDPVVGSNTTARVRTIALDATFASGHTLTIDGILKVEGPDTTTTFWNRAANIDFGTGGSLRIETTTFEWSAGNITNSGGSVYVYGSGTLDVRGGNKTLEADLWVGQTPDTGAASNGWVNLSSMTGNLTLGNQSVVTIYGEGGTDYGRLQLHQIMLPDTTGGIRRVDNNSEALIILEGGTVERSLGGITTLLKVEVPLLVEGGDFKVDSGIEFSTLTTDFYESVEVSGSSSRFILEGGGKIKANEKILISNAGDLLVQPRGTTVTSTIQANVTMTGAASLFAIKSDGTNYASLILVGNLVLKDGTLAFDVAGGGTTCAKITLNGNLTINPSTGDSCDLDVVVVGALGHNKSWEVITPSMGTRSGDFNTFLDKADDANWGYNWTEQGGLYKLTLTYT